MLLLITSFLAGILTVFAPCVLILLPVIVGSSLANDKDEAIDKKKPYIIAISLGVSVLLFTLLLKASTAFIGVDPQVWKSVSGGIVILLGLSLLFPLMWAKLSAKVGLENNSNRLLSTASRKSGIGGYILTGAALGPVFSACSPVYVLILATVLPVNFALGLVYMTLYAAGLTLALLAIALAGRRLTKRMNWGAEPSGWFRRSLAILLLLVGLAVITGVDKTVQTWILSNSPINSTKLEEKLIPSKDTSPKSGGGEAEAKFNVTPYNAPELRDIASWINSDPQTLANLKGKVVLIDFWTYSCINCIRTQPYLNAWHDKYKDDGLVIIGVHAPEFAFEKVTKNVEEAVRQAKIKYPVGLDNDFSTWRAYKNQFWPAKYLIDKNGQVRYTHFGEGEYEETEATIQTLLNESGADVSDKLTTESKSNKTSSDQTSETYISYSRGERFANTDQFIEDTTVKYTLKDSLEPHQWSFGGDWKIGQESSLSGDDAQLRINYSAREVYLVMSGPAGAKVGLSVEGVDSFGGSDVNQQNQVTLDGARLYTLVSTDNFLKNKTLTLTFPAGVTVNAFTFGN